MSVFVSIIYGGRGGEEGGGIYNHLTKVGRVGQREGDNVLDV